MTQPTTPRRPWLRTRPRPRRPDVIVREGEPLAEIAIYPDVIQYTRRQGSGWRSYPISANALALTLARVPTVSGLLPPNTLGTGRVHGDPFYVVYVPPHRRALRTPQREYTIPLPPLVWAGWRTDYRIWALHAEGAPTKAQTALCRAPFPNTYSNGAICWGTSDGRPAASPGALDRVLSLFLEGSYFNNHGAGGASARYPTSVLARWSGLAKRKAEAYPLSDLIPAGYRLDWLLEGGPWNGDEA